MGTRPTANSRRQDGRVTTVGHFSDAGRLSHATLTSLTVVRRRCTWCVRRAEPTTRCSSQFGAGGAFVGFTPLLASGSIAAGGSPWAVLKTEAGCVLPGASAASAGFSVLGA